MKHPKDIPISQFQYDLPPEKIAAYPLQKRDESKLLIYRGGEITESKFKEIPSLLEKDSLLVFNRTKVINARLIFRNKKAQTIEIFCLEPSEQEMEPSTAMSLNGRLRWNCLVGNLKRWKEEEDLCLEAENFKLYARLVEKREQYVVVEFYWEPGELHFSEVIEATGQTPIPPYLKRDSDQSDKSRYQTIYAKEEGSVAAPTAGLHFTDEVFEALEKRSIASAFVTLHVGAGTFRPVKAARMEDHDMHAEWIEASRETLEELRQSSGKAIIAVGTTSLRTLESLYWMGVKAYENKAAGLQDLEIRQWDVYDKNEVSLSVQESLEALLAWMQAKGIDKLICRTQILIAPPYQLRLARGIITNFHQPQSTLLLLIAAVVGEAWRDIYNYALSHDFRFLSYGDSSLLLK